MKVLMLVLLMTTAGWWRWFIPIWGHCLTALDLQTKTRDGSDARCHTYNCISNHHHIITAQSLFPSPPSPLSLYRHQYPWLPVNLKKADKLGGEVVVLFAGDGGGGGGLLE